MGRHLPPGSRVDRGASRVGSFDPLGSQGTHKQLLKQQLNFAGYRIGELYPRRTRRATAVNWLLAWLAQQGEPLPEQGPLGPELPPPGDPVQGHPGDLPVK